MSQLPRPTGSSSPWALVGAMILIAVILAVAVSTVLPRPNLPERTAAPSGAPAGTGAIAQVSPTVGGPADGTAEPTTGSLPTARPNPGPTPGATPGATPAATPAATPRPTPHPTSGGGSLPVFRHVYVVVMENEESGSIVGSSSAPYINSLIGKYGLATNYTAVDHPSEPNYIALFSGSTHGITDDGKYDLAGTNIADQVEAHGRDWRVFAQNLPSTPCYTGSTSSGGPDGSGEYARKHEPAISFTDISGNASRCAKIQNFSHFSPGAADYELIVPNLCNDMHDCGVKTGDTFLKGFLPKILGSSAMRGSVLFLTWDEGSSGTGGGGKVATVVIGDGVPAGFTSAVRYSHYSLLRTIEDSWGLGCLGSACSANDMRAFWP